ncbi:hypothetical protein EZM97_14640 [Dyella soli]|uniref:FAS1 domain-containing protein n=1 Tax=Dyella soli TaxID=522319 RepID=A0A4R0Z0E7_9GAMM|nr:hypothetical protein EZM97_14640 [Dyella soli]
MTKEGDKLDIGGATIMGQEIAASNGTIHAIDAVIVPTKH